MRLNNQQGRLVGCYSSKTGSVGAYPIIGFVDTKPDLLSRTTVALAIPWRSYLRGKGDSSWRWISLFVYNSLVEFILMYHFLKIIFHIV